MQDWTTSSARFKKNIDDISPSMISSLYKLRVRQFKYIEDTADRMQFGMIAEEVATIMPEIVTYDNDDVTSTPRAIQYHQLIPAIVKALQQQRDQTTSGANLPICVSFPSTNVASSSYATVNGGRFIFPADGYTFAIKALFETTDGLTTGVARIYCSTTGLVIAVSNTFGGSTGKVIPAWGTISNVPISGDNVFELQVRRLTGLSGILVHSLMLV